jgi:hypothetical protein
MRRAAWLLCTICVLSAPGAFSQSENAAPSPVPKVLVSGFDAYRAGGPDEAMRVWLRNSPLEGTPDAGTEEGILHATQGRFGPWRAFDVVSIHQLSPSTRIIYMTLDYDKGPLFAKFVLYHTGQGWIVTNLLFSPNDAEVLPVQQP